MKRLRFTHPALYIAIFTLCWAIIEMLGASAGVSAYQVVWTRYGVHLAFMALVFGPRYGTALVRTPKLGQQIFGSLLMLGMPLSFLWALRTMAPNDAWSVFWVAPLLVIAIAAAMRDRLGGVWTTMASVCGLIGAWLIYKPDLGIFQPAALFAFGMALCFALYMVVMRSMRQEPIMTKLFHTALWVFIGMSVILPSVWYRPTLHGLLAMIAIGVFGWFGLYALDRALEAAPAAILAPVLYTELVWDLLLHWRPHVALGGRTDLGALLIVVAACATFVWRRERHAISVERVTA
jgi:hypothetical protein